MNNLTIKLDSVEEVTEFLNIVNGYDSSMELSYGRYTVDGRSIMGIFSLDLNRDLTLKIEKAEILPELTEELRPYIVA